MKSVNMIGMTLGVGLIAALGVTPVAYAGVNNVSGVICQPDIPSQHVNINYEITGVSNIGPSPMKVTCPIIRTSTTSTGATVWVDVSHAVNAKTSCAVVSTDFDGKFLGSDVETFIGAGNKSMPMYIANGQSSFWGRYVVECTIPANQVGTIRGIILDE